MGAGKSTVGRLLAQRLGYTFIDTDHEIEMRTGASIPLIFEFEGEEGFRKRESEVVAELTQRERIVLATGGGAIIAPSNRDLLHQRGQVIYLRANLHYLWQRVQRDRNRPLLRTADPKARLAQLMHQREAFYQNCAHHVVETGKNSASAMVDTILMQLELSTQFQPGATAHCLHDASLSQHAA